MKAAFKKYSWNPSLAEDAVKYLSLGTSLTALKAIRKKWSDDKRNRFDALIDRLEFTDHLNVLLSNARNHHFRLDGHNLDGLDNDIPALRLYLILTCIDVCIGKRGETTKKFLNAIANLSPSTRARLETNLRVTGGERIKPYLASYPRSWAKIAGCLYALRNGYTHGGVRFQYIDNSSLLQIHRTYGNYGLAIAQGFDLYRELKEVVAEIARKAFNLS